MTKGQWICLFDSELSWVCSLNSATLRALTDWGGGFLSVLLSVLSSGGWLAELGIKTGHCRRGDVEIWTCGHVEIWTTVAQKAERSSTYQKVVKTVQRDHFGGDGKWNFIIQRGVGHPFASCSGSEKLRALNLDTADVSFVTWGCLPANNEFHPFQICENRLIGAFVLSSGRLLNFFFFFVNDSQEAQSVNTLDFKHFLAGKGQFWKCPSFVPSDVFECLVWSDQQSETQSCSVYCDVVIS